MSYNITVYCNDETIQTTSVYIPSARPTPYTGDYGSSSLGDWNEFTVESLPESWSAEFSVTPTSGCSFSSWVYRVGSDDAPVQTLSVGDIIPGTNETLDASGTWTYTGGQDIYIRAEGVYGSGGGGSDEDDTWFISGEYLDTPEPGEGIFYDIEHSAMQLGRYNIRFTNSGYANFFITGANANFRIYLGTNSDAINGVPTSAAQYSTLGFECRVSANTEYYVWVRAEDGRDALRGTLCIQPPSLVTNVPRWSWYSSNGTANLEQTEASHNALLNLEATTNFNYRVWNDLYLKTKQILEEIQLFNATSQWWDDTYLAYGKTAMSTSNGYTLTAKRFNSLRHNIDRLSYTGIGEVSPGDVVRAYYFLRLAECLNDWIDNHQG